MLVSGMAKYYFMDDQLSILLVNVTHQCVYLNVVLPRSCIPELRNFSRTPSACVGVACSPGPPGISHWALGEACAVTASCSQCLPCPPVLPLLEGMRL